MASIEVGIACLCWMETFVHSLHIVAKDEEMDENWNGKNKSDGLIDMWWWINRYVEGKQEVTTLVRADQLVEKLPIVK